jgi:hypothetical protein
MKVIEYILLQVTLLLLIFYIYNDDNLIKVDSFIMISLFLLATLVNCFCIKYEETPCNATI